MVPQAGNIKDIHVGLSPILISILNMGTKQLYILQLTPWAFHPSHLVPRFGVLVGVVLQSEFPIRLLQLCRRRVWRHA